MKKLFPILFLFVSALFIFSCKDDDDYVDTDTYSAVYDLKNVSFEYNTTDGWNIYKSFNSAMYNSDVMLIFRQTGTTSDGSPVWQQIPRTLYLTVANNPQELDYDFDFSKYDFYIYAGGTYDLTLTPQYLNNQTFRIVLVPGYFGKSANGESLQNMSYDQIIKKFNIDDTKVKTL